MPTGGATPSSGSFDVQASVSDTNEDLVLSLECRHDLFSEAEYQVGIGSTVT
jgi:hypothetical protein